MNFLNIDFLFFAKTDGLIQIIVSAVIIIVTAIASAKGAKKKKEEMEKRKQNVQQNYTPPRAVPQNQQKFWGVKLDPVRMEPDNSDEEYIEYDEDDEELDPLEPRPQQVARNFAHKIIEPDEIPVKHLGSLENKQFTSNIEQDSLQSDIEMQQFINDLDSMGELSDSGNLISDGNYDDEEDDLSIQINVAKGSREALVHAIVLGEIFGPPMCMRAPYNQQEDEDAFRKSTLF